MSSRSQASEFPSALRAPVAGLRAAVDDLLIAQPDAKLGVLLALVARRHAYLEGPPGCGKSRLAEGLTRLVSARRWVLAFHRDTRETDLLGDAVLRRESHPAKRLERLRIDTAAGPLLESEVVVLEDLSRAPGEALGPLLQILGSRRALGMDLPLETAIATAPPASLETPVEPLEPSQLDRFAIQVPMRGVVQQREWGAASRLLDQACVAGLWSLDQSEPVVTASQRRQLQDYAQQLPVRESVLVRYREWIQRLRVLVAAAAPTEPFLLSDRAFGRAALAVLRAHATLRCSANVEAADLRALRLMLGRRVPEEVREHVEDLTEEIVQDAEKTQVEVPSGGTQAAPSWLDPDELPPSTEAAPQAEVDLEPGIALEEDEDLADVVLRDEVQEPADVEALLAAFVGRIERGRHDPDTDPGGQPRSYRPLHRLDEIMDGDLVEALLFTECRLPGQPRVYRRTRRNAGGAVVILRDVSSSMAGQRNVWAGEVIAGLVKVAARRRMRVGYIEFHHRALPRDIGGRLLHRAYGRLFELAASAHPLGQTNYEEPLSIALQSLRGRRGRNRHVVMLTDGLPISGDTRVLTERRLAQRLGVNLHTVFIGEGECPLVLDDISRETNGLRFQAKSSGKRLRVEERA